ncbi:uncharacterized protein LOC120640010 [Panicum virgatum]|uniref:uncharacterized protein LOC120640010 n=1 Tax=Panicum virgatum TaxID=38727 RepID=UPI0019D544BA|nr:uncharacterized protein LOC120640010 [Panicum virgatum]
MENVPTTKRCLKNLCHKINREQAENDIKKTLNLFGEFMKDDPGFMYSIDQDEDGRIKTMIWTNSKSRMQYENFGDAITFDTTYKTNMYEMPFGLFVGVNNHFQSVLLGGVLMTDEKIGTFRWIFKEFTRLMGGKEPVTILTDPFVLQIYATREKWVKSYFKGIFCARMTSTQRSESANMMLKNIVPPNSTLHKFVEQYSKLQFIRDQDEDYEEKKSKKVLISQGVQKISDGLIVKHWTMKARIMLPAHLGAYGNKDVSLMAQTYRHSSIMISVLEYVELGDRNIESYKIGMQFLEEGKKAMKALDIERDGLGLANRENDTHLPEEGSDLAVGAKLEGAMGQGIVHKLIGNKRKKGDSTLGLVESSDSELEGIAGEEGEGDNYSVDLFGTGKEEVELAEGDQCSGTFGGQENDSSADELDDASSLASKRVDASSAEK